jgi:glutamate synthase (NADPH/NADH) small chain
MRMLPPDQALSGFDEVALGYGEDEVVAEAERCLLCLYPLCVDGCPNGNPIPDFIGLVQERRFLEAAAVDDEHNPLASCTGRVCAWERQCEGACVLNVCGEGVRIGAIERFIADVALRQAEAADAPRAARGQGLPESAPAARVAVVGAGPGGLSCAAFLARAGVAVTVLDASGRAGGLLGDGIPEFVLPWATVAAEVERLERAGVRFRFSTRLGRDVTLEGLRREFDAVFLAIGASRALTPGVPGEDAEGVWTAQAFLRRAKLALGRGGGEGPPAVGDRVVVVGAGNTAMDAARTARRLGARDVRVLYRRTERQSPSRAVEVEHARAEGVVFDYLVNPVAFLAGDSGRLRAVRLVRMRLGEPDASGRPRSEPVPGSEFELPCDTAILAVGYAVEGGAAGRPELLDGRGRVRAGAEDGRTPVDGVFAGGDAVRGPATVVEAVRDGRVAARSILEWLARRSPAPVSGNR